MPPAELRYNAAEFPEARNFISVITENFFRREGNPAVAAGTSREEIFPFVRNDGGLRSWFSRCFRGGVWNAPIHGVPVISNEVRNLPERSGKSPATTSPRAAGEISHFVRNDGNAVRNDGNAVRNGGNFVRNDGGFCPWFSRSPKGGGAGVPPIGGKIVSLHP